MDFFEDDKSSDLGPSENMPIMQPPQQRWEVRGGEGGRGREGGREGGGEGGGEGRETRERGGRGGRGGRGERESESEYEANEGMKEAEKA